MDLLQDTNYLIAPCGQRSTTFLRQKKQCQLENDQCTNTTKGSISVGTGESLSVGIVVVVIIIRELKNHEEIHDDDVY